MTHDPTNNVSARLLRFALHYLLVVQGAHPKQLPNPGRTGCGANDGNHPWGLGRTPARDTPLCRHGIAHIPWVSLFGPRALRPGAQWPSGLLHRSNRPFAPMATTILPLAL